MVSEENGIDDGETLWEEGGGQRGAANLKDEKPVPQSPLPGKSTMASKG